MSLDLSNRTARVHNTAAFDVDGTTITDLSTVALGTFDSGEVEEAGKFLLQATMSGGADLDANTLPVTLVSAAGEELFIDGVELTIIKVDATPAKVTFLDPVTGINYAYVNRQGESITLVYDASQGAGNERWVAKV